MRNFQSRSASEKILTDFRREYNSYGLRIKRFHWTDWVFEMWLLQNNGFNLHAWEGSYHMANEIAERTKMQWIYEKVAFYDVELC